MLCQPRGIYNLNKGQCFAPQIMNRKSMLSILKMFCFASFALFARHALATDFEVGTQFGFYHVIPDDTDSSKNTAYTYIQIPSPLVSAGEAPPTSLYAAWFPGKRFSIGPEFSIGRYADSASNTWTSFYVGTRAAYFLNSHSVSSPYVLGRVSGMFTSQPSISIIDDDSWTSFGMGWGYQWRIRLAFILRTEVQYQRVLGRKVLLSKEDAHEFSFVVGLGTRFGNNKKLTSKIGFGTE